MHRYFIQLAYDGTAYHGWQYQPNALSIQQLVAEALSMILRTGTELTGCGRTDTGVHASCFYAHFDREQPLTALACQQLADKLNAFLPADISILRLFPVAADTHARFSACARTYEYRISRQKDPFTRAFTYLYRFSPDLKRMNAGARIIMEYRDFSCFSKSHTQTKTNDCHIHLAEWTEENGLLIFRITADRFLRNMVRAIVGTLLDMGRGKLDEAALRALLVSGNRSEAGQSMPAHGLFLTDVAYPEGLLTYTPD